MNRYDFYFEQLVTQADMDGAFGFAETADQRLMTDNGYTGVVQGLEVVQAFPTPNLTVNVDVGVAYDQIGQRCAITTPQNLDISQDSSAVSTAVSVPGNEKWISIFIAFDRLASDPRVDGNGIPLNYLLSESFQFIVDQGAESAAGTPAVYTSAIAEAYSIGAAQTLDVSVDGTAPQTVTFAGTETTAAQVAAAITAQVVGVTAADNGGFVELTSAGSGPGASILVTGGSTAAAFAFPPTPAIGAGGPARPALRPDAILLADVQLRFGTTQVVDKPDPGGSVGVIDQDARRQTVFEYNGAFNIKGGTITDFADALSAILNTHISNTGNAHPASAITFDGGPIPAAWSNLKVSPELQTAMLAVTQDLADVSPGSDGAGLVGVGITGVDIVPGTLESVLSDLDSLKGSLGNANTWTSDNDFSNAVDMDGGARIDSFLTIGSTAAAAAARHYPTDALGADTWDFGFAGLATPAPWEWFGGNATHTLTAGVSEYDFLVHRGSASPTEATVGMVEGHIMLWDDGASASPETTVYTFRIVFNQPFAGSTADATLQAETALTVGGGVSDLTSILVVTPAGNGDVILRTAWGANAGQQRNIACVWRRVRFDQSQP